METTTKTKFWPDAHVSKDAEYVGSFPSGARSARYDLYLHGDNRVRFVFANDRSATYSMKEVLEYAKGAAQDHLDASLLLAAHRTRTPAPSAPAAMSITREQLEAMARKRYESLGKAYEWDRLNDGARSNQLGALTASLADIGITVAPPPPPQKSEGQRIAESLVVNTVSSILIGEVPFRCCINAKNEREASTTADAIIHVFATAIDNALDARDEEHRAALEPLLKLIDQPYRDTYSQYEPYIREIREQARKLAERSAAK